MKRVLTAVVLIPVVLLAVLTLPGWAVAALAGMVGMLATREFLQMVKTHAIEPFRIPVYVALVLY
ncbi:MAG: phosphatidate cytidylyltransferase, partial [Terriglobales bacterium]